MKKSWMLVILLSLGLGLGSIAMANGDDEEEDEDRIELSDQEVLTFLKTNIPELYEELQDVRKEEGKEEYLDYLEEMKYEVEYYFELKEISPETAEALLQAEQLEQATWPIAEKIAATEDKETKAALSAELRDTLEKVFDLRLKEYAFEIEELEAELNEIKAEFERRQTKRDLILDNRMKEIMSEVDEALSWW